MASNPIQRLSAGLIALAAWLGLSSQLVVSNELIGSLSLTVWRMLAYFTVLTNLLVAVLFTGIALGNSQFMRASIIGGVTVAILLVGVVYGLLLRGLIELSAGAVLADFLLHDVTPILALLYWIAFVPKGRLQWRHALLWAAYPLAYLVYALVRGSVEDRYPYPFLDPGKIGWDATVTNSALILLGLLVASFALIWVDARLSRGARGVN